MPSEEDNRNCSSSKLDAGAHGREWLNIELLALGSDTIGGMVVQSAEMREVFKRIARLGPYNTTVLVYGASGTGKELVARALHTLGPTPNGSFVTFNLLQFGRVPCRVAAIWAYSRSLHRCPRRLTGLFPFSQRRHAVLDEIAELPLQLQPKLLRAVELHEIQPVGSAQTYKVHIRLIAATNRDLRAMVKASQFRDDLYYRLSATAVMVPPLRQRREAIGALTAHCVEHYNRLFGKNVRFVSRRALAVLTAYEWTGNVREFSHAIQSAVMLTDNDRLDVTELPEQVAHTPAKAELITQPSALALRPSEAPGPHSEPEAQSPLLLDDVVKKTVEQTLEQTEGNRSQAAHLLGISRSTLYRMI